MELITDPAVLFVDGMCITVMRMELGMAMAMVMVILQCGDRTYQWPRFVYGRESRSIATRIGTAGPYCHHHNPPGKIV